MFENLKKILKMRVFYLLNFSSFVKVHYILDRISVLYQVSVYAGFCLIFLKHTYCHMGKKLLPQVFFTTEKVKFLIALALDILMELRTIYLATNFN